MSCNSHQSTDQLSVLSVVQPENLASCGEEFLGRENLLQRILLRRCDSPERVAELFSRKLDEVSARFADRAADVGSGSLVVDLRAVSATESTQEGAFGCATYQVWCREALLALGSIYVVDCHDWMVVQVRQLLREILFDRHSSLFGEGSPSEEFSGLVDQILSLNIIHGDHLTLRRLFAESDTSLQTIAGVGQGDQLMLYEWFIAPDGTVGHHKYRMVDIIGNGVK